MTPEEDELFDNLNLVVWLLANGEVQRAREVLEQTIRAYKAESGLTTRAG